ncbi:MAG TPA: hypothetical protein VG142_11385 [Trebonia sp.]|nr:hypothetical protein [Trebonia sp.]
MADEPRRPLTLRYTPTVSSTGPVAPVPPPEEFTGPRPMPGTDSARESRGPAQGRRVPAGSRVSQENQLPASRRRPASRWEGDALNGERGEEAIRRLKNQSVRESRPSAFSRIASPFLAVIRGRNWLTGLVIPIVVAIVVGIAVVIIAGANNASGHVPSSLSAGFPPARNAAADFTDTPALAGRGVDQQLSQVAVAGTTAVAVGSQTGTRLPRPRFFYSADSGKTWRLATIRGMPAPGSGAALVAGGARGWLALGSTSTFTSPNGQSWLPEAPLPEVRGDRVSVLTATASGFLAAGSNVPGGDTDQASPVVWLSANGTTWQRISGTQLGLTSEAGPVLGITSVAANGDTVVISASVEGGGSATWMSANGGKTWTPVTVPAGTDDSATIAGLAPLGKGFVAVRATPANGSADVFISTNATTWSQSATLATANGAPLTLGFVSGGPAGAVVTGQADGFQIAFISANGTTWTGTDPVTSTAAESLSGAALNGDGQAVIAGTSAGDAAQQQPMLTVIGTQGGPDQIDVRAIPGATIPEISVGAIAASGATEVAAGSADGFPSLWISGDGGVAWTRATGSASAVLNRTGEEQLTGVTHGGAGWVAVGGPATVGASGDGGGIGHPVVVTSAGGETWTAADGETAFGGTGAVTSSVAEDREGYVIVGSQVVSGRTIAAAWYADGLTGWQSATDARPGALDGTGTRQMNAVAATLRGFAAVGSVGGHPAAWQSATGRTWSETTLPLPVGAASATLQYAAASGNTVAAIGSATTAGGMAFPFAAVSANGGATWTDTLLPMPKETASGASGKGTSGTGAIAPATALTAAGGGFTATGTYGAAGAQDVVVWLLDRGTAPDTTWTMATPAGTGLAGSGTQAITALTSVGATLTGVGFAATSGAEEPTLWQSPVRS